MAKSYRSKRSRRSSLRPLSGEALESRRLKAGDLAEAPETIEAFSEGVMEPPAEICENVDGSVPENACAPLDLLPGDTHGRAAVSVVSPQGPEGAHGSPEDTPPAEENAPPAEEDAPLLNADGPNSAYHMLNDFIAELDKERGSAEIAGMSPLGFTGASGPQDSLGKLPQHPEEYNRIGSRPQPQD